MDPVAGLLVVDVLAGLLLVAAGFWLMWERRPDDPTYTPQHTAGAVQSELERAVSDSHRKLRRSPAPWAPPPETSRDVNPLGDF